jgi:hypothetical protein
VNLIHWNGDLASAVGGIDDFHIFNFRLHGVDLLLYFLFAAQFGVSNIK